MAAAARYGERRAELLALGGAAKLRLYGASLMAEDLVVLDEWEGKQRLAAAGVPVPEGRLVGGADAAERGHGAGVPGRGQDGERGVAHTRPKPARCGWA